MAAELSLFKYSVIKPFSIFGLKHEFFDVHIDTLIYTWLGVALIVVGAMVARMFMKKDPFSLISLVLQQTMEFFSELCIESMGRFEYKFFAFSTAIFLFTLACNLVGLLPFVEESTRDLNTTLAIAVSSFFFVQYQHLKISGLLGYLKSYTQPIPLMLPLEIIGKISSIVSMSFRLFGNIIGGSMVFLLMVNAIGTYKEIFMLFSVIILVAYQLLQKVVDFNEHKVIKNVFASMFILVFFLAGAQVYFGIFEGFVQAFVLAMLTLTYLSVAVAEDSEEAI